MLSSPVVGSGLVSFFWLHITAACIEGCGLCLVRYFVLCSSNHSEVDSASSGSDEEDQDFTTVASLAFGTNPVPVLDDSKSIST